MRRVRVRGVLESRWIVRRVLMDAWMYWVGVFETVKVESFTYHHKSPTCEKFK